MIRGEFNMKHKNSIGDCMVIPEMTKKEIDY